MTKTIKTTLVKESEIEVWDEESESFVLNQPSKFFVTLATGDLLFLHTRDRLAAQQYIDSEYGKGFYVVLQHNKVVEVVNIQRQALLLESVLEVGSRKVRREMEKTFVYLVLGHDTHDTQILDIFDSDEKAQTFLDEYDGDDGFAFITVRAMEVK